MPKHGPPKRESGLKKWELASRVLSTPGAILIGMVLVALAFKL